MCQTNNNANIHIEAVVNIHSPLVNQVSFMKSSESEGMRYSKKSYSLNLVYLNT